ncbi:hypothetical protein [Pelagibacterium lacus]|uniref:DUF945 family protein n=1 Tax=Pelagibacterium lacus TaxID=2282655 RepID=A0A369WD61_9HYPH|nr:hypothetical protein [Pelagibacterium lacus]RDE10041.1 hypothetical protein DVH29_03680 [Pelagibacterium lacus]
MIKNVTRLMLLSAALLGGTSTAALALEADQFADRLVETARIMGLSFAYDAATADGDTITISDFTILLPGEDPIEVPGDLVFEGVVETADGGYTAARATIADVDYTDEDEGFSVSLVDIAVEGIELPAQVSVANAMQIGMSLYDRMVAGPLAVTDPDGNEVFTVALMESAVSESAADGGITSSYDVSGIRVDLSSLEEPEARKALEALGMEVFTGSMGGSGTWWPDTGVVSLDDMSFVADDLASFSMAFALEGYTEELYTEMMKINLKMAEMTEAGEELSDEQVMAMSQSMLASMEDVKLASGSLRYDDASLFMKVLEIIGAEQGVDADTFKAGLQFMVPMALAEVEDQAFKTMVTNAVNTFIADPQNFTISVAPDEPVAFSTFEERADEIESDPFVLVDLLNVQITAND